MNKAVPAGRQESRIKIKILMEYEDFLVISKPDDISVHEGAGEEQYTVVDWLKETHPEILKLDWQSKIRPGIVHRLDKDTSGVLLLSKNPEALDYFQAQFKNREVEKHYLTLVCGKLPSQTGRIDAFIRRDPKDRERQKVEYVNFGLDEADRKQSATEYEVKEIFNFKGYILSLVDIKLLTGRKHQIRVHLKYEGCPVVGDTKYFNKASKRVSKELGLTRQFLHSISLKFKNKKGEWVEVKDELPDDLARALNRVKSEKLPASASSFAKATDDKKATAGGKVKS